MTFVALALAAVVLAAANFRQRRLFQPPDDGIIWADTPSGPVAQQVRANGPGEMAGILPGDRLVAIGAVTTTSRHALTQQLFNAGVGREVTYKVERHGSFRLLPVRLAVLPQPSTVRGFLQFAGVLYLILGLYVLLYRPYARRAANFFLFCLASFVLFTFSYSGAFDALDWTVYWCSVAAMLLQPVLFVQFCLAQTAGSDPTAEYSVEKRGGENRRTLIIAAYSGAALIGFTHLAAATGVLRTTLSPGELRWAIDRVEVGYVAAMYLAAIAVLALGLQSVKTRLERKQVAWVLMSALLALVPFTLFYCIPYFLGRTPDQWMNASALSLILLPAGMAHTIARYRLLDIEMAIGRGFAYTMATSALVAFYLGVAALAGSFFRMYFPGGGTIGLILAVIATGLLFQPVQHWFQSRLDRYFLRKRYEYRDALLSLAQALSSQTNLHQMTTTLLEGLASILQVCRAAIFVPVDGGPEGPVRSYVVQNALGLERELGFASVLDFGFLEVLEERSSMLRARNRDFLFFPSWQEELVERELLAGRGPDAVPKAAAWSRQETVRKVQLSYYFPCRAQGRLVAVLALGRTSGDELLSSEDAALVATLAGYLAVAVENVKLLDSLTAKAKQYEDLQQFSENILESINVGLVAVDLEDRVEAVNTQLELMYPLPFRQCRGRRLSEIFPPALMAEFDRTRDDARVHNIYRHRVHMENGQERVLNIAIAPLLSKNCEWIGRLVIFDDVTDRVALESQLAQSEKLSSVGLLAAGVAHEVNTPLTVISTQAQMLAKQLPPDDRYSRIVEKIIKQTFRASEIVNSLLNFSRTKGAAFSPVELNRVISETLLLLDHQFKTGHIDVEVILDPDLPPVHGNSDKLQQVFLNLCLNARDAMPHGGRLRIATWTEDSHICVEVRDSGSGISPEHLHRIYDPFFTTKGPGRGTGLGLAVSYGIVQEHSGRIQAESRPGLGTTFHLEFPALRKPVHA